MTVWDLFRVISILFDISISFLLGWSFRTGSYISLHNLLLFTYFTLNTCTLNITRGLKADSHFSFHSR